MKKRILSAILATTMVITPMFAAAEEIPSADEGNINMGISIGDDEVVFEEPMKDDALAVINPNSAAYAEDENVNTAMYLESIDDIIDLTADWTDPYADGNFSQDEMVGATQQQYASMNLATAFINTYVYADAYKTPIKAPTTSAQQEELNKVAKEIIEGQQTESEKILAIVKYVSTRVSYDWSGSSSNIAPYDVYKNQKAMSPGYAILTQYFCNAVDIPCMLIVGDNNLYNAIYNKTTKTWIYVDVTLCSNDNSNGAKFNSEWYNVNPDRLATDAKHYILNPIQKIIYGTNSLYYTLITDSSYDLYKLNTDAVKWLDTSTWYLQISGRCGIGSLSSVTSLYNIPVTRAPMNSQYWYLLSNDKALHPTKGATDDSLDFDKIFSLNLAASRITSISAIPANTSIQYLILPSTLQIAYDNAFFYCRSLKGIDYSKTSITTLGMNTVPIDLVGGNGKKFTFPSTLKNVSPGAEYPIGTSANKFQGWYGADGKLYTNLKAAIEAKQYTLTLVVGTSVSPAGYTDLDMTKWYASAVTYVLNNKLMSGIGNNKFDPYGACTRAMMVTILYTASNKPAVSGSTPFTDLKSDWYLNPVLWAYTNKITGGTNATTFSPNANVTREQVATFLMGYAQKNGYDIESRAGISMYKDRAQVSSWAVEAMKWAKANGIINGVTDTELNPKGNASRAQIAQMIMAFQKKFKK